MFDMQKHTIFIVLSIGLFAILYPLFPGMVQATLYGGAEYRLFIPAIMLFLIWLRADRLRETPVSASAWGFLAAAAGLAGCYCFIYVSVNGPLLGISVITAVAGSLWWALGTPVMRQIAGPLSLMVFMVPVPGMRQALLSLRQVTGYAVTALVDPVYFISASDIPIVQYTRRVVSADNGAVLERYFLALSIISVAYAVSIRGSVPRRTFLAALFVPITIAADTLRLLVLGTAVWRYGGDIAVQEGFAAAAGAIFWAGALAMLVAAKRIIVDRASSVASGNGKRTRLRRESTSNNPAKEEGI